MRITAVLVIAITMSTKAFSATVHAPGLVPTTKIPGEKSMEVQVLIDELYLGPQTLVFEDSDHVFHKWKRLHMPYSEDGRVAPDTGKEIEEIATCKKIKSFPDASYKNVSVLLHNSTGVLELRYPLEYECTLDIEKTKGMIRDEAILYEQTRPDTIAMTPGMCDGRQMRGYVESTILSARGILSAVGSWSPGVALGNYNLMGGYYRGASDVREHDLYLKRRGCTSLLGGPSDDQLKELRRVVLEVEQMSAREAASPGVITGPYGELPRR